jgi:bifunctional non-homologous end joining protein LigD
MQIRNLRGNHRSLASRQMSPTDILRQDVTEWTQADQLRHPVFLGVRSDKQAKDVVRE